MCLSGLGFFTRFGGGRGDLEELLLLLALRLDRFVCLEGGGAGDGLDSLALGCSSGPPGGDDCSLVFFWAALGSGEADLLPFFSGDDVLEDSEALRGTSFFADLLSVFFSGDGD